MRNPKTKAWLGLVITLSVMAFALFLSAGTVDYWQAWVYLGVFSTVSSLITVYLMKKDPALLERRAAGGPTQEKRPVEKVIMSFASLGFVAVPIVSGLDRRFGWTNVPPDLCIAGDLLTVLGFWIVLRVFKENTFASSTIETATNQTVISTGPYSLVRHPMYSGGAVYMLAMPLALGSYWGLPAAAFMLSFLVWRLFDEEKFLAGNLPGYTAYCSQVRWRLVPGVF